MKSACVSTSQKTTSRAAISVLFITSSRQAYRILSSRRGCTKLESPATRNGLGGDASLRGGDILPRLIRKDLRRIQASDYRDESEIACRWGRRENRAAGPCQFSWEVDHAGYRAAASRRLPGGGAS